MVVLHRLDNYLATVERAAVVVLLMALLGLGLLQLLLRNLFASGLFWADTLLRHLVLWLGLLGASLATHTRQHLSLDALVHVVPDRYRPWLAVLTHLTAAAVCLLLVQAAWRFVQNEYSAGTALVPGVATWLAVSIIPLELLVMSLRFALRALEILRQSLQRSRRI
jgi:TRAP-type C4-dicarboxylate transport system permease small subunit